MTATAVLLIYYKTKADHNSDSDVGFDQDHIGDSIVVGILCGLLLLPYPESFTNWLKIHFVRDKA